MGFCDLIEDGGGIFKPLNKRCCSDILCLLFFLVYLVAQIIIAIFALGNGEINTLLYPSDKYGQLCGLSGPVADKPLAYFPRLDQDAQEQAYLLAIPGGIVNFRPTTLCVDACPPAFSITNPLTFGGPLYPGANTNAPDNATYYNLMGTTAAYTYCLPRTQSNPALNRQLCSIPACTNVSDVCGFSPGCTTISSDAAASAVAWELDPTNATHMSCCQYSVQEVNTQSFLPPDADASSQYYTTQFANYVNSAFGVFRSLRENFSQVMIMGIAAPFAFAMVWFVLLFLFAGFIIVAALILFLVALIALAAYFYYRAGWVSTDAVVDSVSSYVSVFNASSTSTPTDADVSTMGYAVLAVLTTISVIAYIIFLIMTRDAIKRCIAIVREVTKVLFSLPFMSFWPCVSIAFQLGIFAYLVLIGGFIMTQDQTTFEAVAAAIAEQAQAAANATTAAAADAQAAAGTDAGSGLAAAGTDAAMAATTDALAAVASLDNTTRVAILMVIHCVGCIWAYFICLGATYATLSRSAAVWFFNHGYDEASGEVVPTTSYAGGVRVVLACAWCIFSRHLGSIAFGAAILTIMTCLRIILEAVDYYTKDMQDTNLLLKITLKCAKCCLWCMDKTVKYITFYGYIFVAIEGTSFCAACIATFSFIIKYPAQMSVNGLVGKLLSCVISLSIPVGCAFLAFVWIDANGGYGPFYCVVIVGLLSFVIASAITDVFKCCIDTIFICAFKDMEEHTPPKFMSSSLREGFGIADVTPAGPTVQKGEGTEMTEKA